jgi:hypothetical protein
MGCLINKSGSPYFKEISPHDLGDQENFVFPSLPGAKPPGSVLIKPPAGLRSAGGYCMVG